MTNIEDRLSTDPELADADLAALGSESGAAQDQTAARATRERLSVPFDLERCWWLLVGVLLIVWGLRFDAYVTLRPWVAAPMVVEIALGFAVAVVALVPGVEVSKRRRALVVVALVAVLVGFAIWGYLQLITAPAYGTDEVAFDQYAALLLVHGIDPYLRSMAPAYRLFHVSPNGHTFTLSGHSVTTLSYPALSFLVYAPFAAFGWTTQMAVVVDSAAWALTVVLLVVLLPRSLKAVGLVLGSLSIYIGYALGGVTDPLFMPLLIGAAWQWDRFPSQRGWRRWLGPVLLGLAASVKQTAWLLLPFLVVGVALEARALPRRRRSARWVRDALAYAAWAALAFVVVNLPFIVLGPSAWLRGILAPVASHAVPAGQGMVALSLFLHLGGGSLGAYTIAGGAVGAALVACYASCYSVLKRVTFLLPSVVLFFIGRAFGSYFVDLVPAAVVGAICVSPTARRVVWRYWWAAVGASAALVVGAVGFALGDGPPLALRVDSVATTGQLATVDRIGVLVTNHARHTLTPAFTIESGGGITAFWAPLGGPRPVRPGKSEQFTLLAPNFFSMPPVSGGFQVIAFTDKPASASASGAYVPDRAYLEIEPAALNHPVDVGVPVTIHVELVNDLDRPVHRAGVPVYLGQVVYAQRGLVLGEASINGSPAGETPVEALTDADGVATFRVVGTVAGRNPVYFEANLVSATQFYPYGYSSILPIRFEVPGSGAEP